MARVQQVASQAPQGSKLPQLTAFLQISKWLFPYFRDVFHKRARYRSYPAGETGVFPLEGKVHGAIRLAVVADWGTGTLESETVAANMQASKPHYTLHLGDVYHLGDAQEIEENCLGKVTKNYGGVTWPLGSHGSFALMGNHEMYSGGQGYYSCFLPRLGMLHEDGSVQSPQHAGFFCLEGEHWIVLGLDTGYHSGGVPLLGMVPGVRNIAALNVDARFDDKMIAWLGKTMTAIDSRSERRKPVIVLTHHQPMSAFEQSFPKPAQQLAATGFFEGRELVWLYGHEHRLTVYEKQTLPGDLVTYPRCVGHGGMPVSESRLEDGDPRVLLYDPRVHAIDCDHPRTKVGYNGHVLLTLEGERLRLEYHDIEENRLLWSETFRPDGKGGLEHECSKPTAKGLTPGGGWVRSTRPDEM